MAGLFKSVRKVLGGQNTILNSPKSVLGSADLVSTAALIKSS